jgi:murein DD-endopeptidase MepM/ murein hydrolase activator NlpD
MGVSGVKEFYYFHPINFLRYVCSEFVMEFNPYLGQLVGGKRVICNPGFAPLYDTNKDKKYNGYADISSYFNERTANKIHEGVDFYAAPTPTNRSGHSPVISFIYGQVVHSGDHGDIRYGKHLIIKSTYEPKHFFLLGHLKGDSHVEKDGLVYPGMTVAYASNTGNCWTGTPPQPVTPEQRSQGRGSHLHVQLIIADKIEDIIKEGDLYEINPKSVNPFYYEEHWGQKQ